MKNVLICDSDHSVHTSLAACFNQNKIKLFSVYDGMTALDYLQRYPIDLILMDMTLPDISGIQICRRIRSNGNLPVIFLSSKNEEIDRLLGLEMGADDFIAKPFSPREVLLRVQRILSAEKISKNTTWQIFANLRLNMESYEAYVEDKPLALTAKEMHVLSYMMVHAEVALRREQFLDDVWDFTYLGDTRAVDATMKRIRKKLCSYDTQFQIDTIYGIGYKLSKKKTVSMS